MSAPILFVIVGKNEPLFEAEIDTHAGTQGSDLSTRQNYFVLHSALDLVEKSAWTTTNMYLRVVDKVRDSLPDMVLVDVQLFVSHRSCILPLKVNHQQVSTFLTAGNIKFMLLHGGKGDEVIKSFFNEVYGYYVKVGSTKFSFSVIISNLANTNIALMCFLAAFNESILQV